MSDIFWNMARIKKAEELLKNGGTYTSLAIYFKVKRNAIAGMCHRYGIKKNAAATSATHAGKGAVTAIKARARREREAVDGVQKRIDISKKAEELIKKDLKTPVVGTVPFPPGPRQCRNIIGESKDLRCCGRPVVKGSPYCADHCRINTPNRPII